MSLNQTKPVVSYINNTYIHNVYKAIYSSICGWWDWYIRSMYFPKQQVHTLTYEKCFRCHTSLPPRQQRTKLNMNYCSPCYDTELQAIFSAILQDFRSF